MEGGCNLWLTQPKHSESHPWRLLSMQYLFGPLTCASGPAEGHPGEACWPHTGEPPDHWVQIQGSPGLLLPRVPSFPQVSEVGPGSHSSKPGDVPGCWLLDSQFQELPIGIFPESFCSLFFTVFFLPLWCLGSSQAVLSLSAWIQMNESITL